MNYGPELICALVPELRKYAGCQLQKIDAGTDWCALSLKGQPSLFFTWNPEIFGICSIASDNLRELRSQSLKTPFMLGLQRHLGGSSIVSVSSIEGDRVLKLTFQRFVGGGVSKELTLIAEFTGRMSNALFTDEEGIIVEAAKHVYPEVNRYRSVIPGTPYTPPPPISGTALLSRMADAELEAVLLSPAGIGRPLARELLRLWAEGHHELVRQALFGQERVFQKIGGYLTVLGALLPGAEAFQGSGLAFCRRYIAGEIEKRALKNIAAGTLKLLERQRGRRAKHVSDLQSQIEKAENCDSYRIAGEAILQNLGKSVERKGTVELEYWDESGLKRVPVKLNPALDLQGNAKFFFKKYQKYRTDVALVREEVAQLQQELDDIADLEANLKRVESAEKLSQLCEQVAIQYAGAEKKAPARQNVKKAKTPLPPHLRFPLGNSVVLVGMNERGNRYVTFQEASPDDLWFHAHEVPGSHVILKNPPAGGDELNRAVRAAASLALYYSDCTEKSAVIDYTEKKQVRHIAGSGPANVTYKRPQTVQVSSEDWKEVLEGRR